MFNIIDAHCHLDDQDYDEDREEIVARLPEMGVLAVVNPGSGRESSARAVALAEKYDRIYACVGTHPHEARFFTTELAEEYEEWLSGKKVVAVGEIGLDYHYDFSPRNIQRKVFEAQLDMAQRADLPVVIHSREASEDTIAILRNFGTRIRALLHSFSESVEDWEKLALYGYFISLGGMVTFRNADRPKALAASVPADRLLLETDGPYLAPVPYRGKRNLPWYAKESLRAIAEIRGEDVEELAKITVKNAGTFYGIPT